MKETTPPDKSQEEYLRVMKIKTAYEKEILSIPNVIGVGIGKAEEEFVLVVLVKSMEKNTPNPDESIPAEIEGVKVEIRPIGQPGAQ